MSMPLVALVAVSPLAATPSPQGFSLVQSFDHSTERGIDLGDLDGDGRADLVQGAVGRDASGFIVTTSFRWARNLGGSAFGPLTLPGPAGPGEAFELRGDVKVADLDGDGHGDVVVTFGGATSGTQVGSVGWFRGIGGGLFEPRRVVFPLGGASESQVIDADGDGDVDVVVRGSSGVRLVENLGGAVPSFASPVLISLGGQSVVRARAVDLDGDGDADLAAMVGTLGELHVAINGGASGFGPLVPQPVPAAYRISLDAADVDGDGDQDLLSTLEDDDRLIWFVNDGSGAFSSSVFVGPTLDRPWSVHAADVDGDGIVDLHHGFPQAGSSTQWFRGLGGGSFGPTQPLVQSVQASTGRQLGMADLDGDGDLEPWAEGIVDDPLNSIQRGVRWVDNQGPASTWTTATVGTPYALFTASAPFDADGDGDLDIACTAISGVSIQINGPLEGRFEERRIVLPGADSNSVPVPADVDGDGDVDLLVALGQFSGPRGVNLALNDGSGQFGPLTLVAPTPPTFLDPSITAVDMDGDGDIDVLIADELGVDEGRWLINDGTGVFTGGPSIIPDVSPNGLAVDVDGDGTAEFVQYDPATAGSVACTLTLYDVSPAGQHTAPIVLDSFAGICGFAGRLAAADVTGNGFIDIVGLDLDTGLVSVLPGLGGGSFGAFLPVASPRGNHGSTLVFDVDLDGANDLVVVGVDGADWVRNLGGGAFGTPVPVGVSAGPLVSGPAAADLDGDGDLDILQGSTILLNDARVGARVCVADAPNSTGQPGVLVAAGSVELATDQFFLVGSQLPPGEFGLFLVGTTTASLPNPGGSLGTLCLGGAIGRFNRPFEIRQVNPAGQLRLQVHLGSVPSGPGPVALVPGDERIFQLWHRDTGAGAPANLTSAIAVRFE